MTLPNDLLATTQMHIEQLVADRMRAGPHLDFKRDLPTAWNNDAKHEFLADTTAFANSGGGDLIFGVDEDGQAQASAVIPQVIPNVDQNIEWECTTSTCRWSHSCRTFYPDPVSAWVGTD